MGQGEVLRASDAFPDRERTAVRSRLVVLVVFAGFTLGVMVPVLRVEPFGLILYPDGSERLMDFASHRAFACAVWRGDATPPGTGSVYTLDAHLRATTEFTHRPAHVALPFGYSPVMLWVLGPTCLVPERVAFTAWALAGLAAIAAVVLTARLPWTAALPFATAVAIYTVALGQTAILSTAGLLWLMMADRDARPQSSPWT